MEGAAAAHARERLMRWLDDGRDILAALADQLDSGLKAGAKVEHAERDAERLRRELMELRKDLSEAKDRAEHNAHDKQLEEYRRQVDELRRANEQLKGEKDEAAQAFAKLLETVQSTNQIAQKLGVAKSPFARTSKEPTAPSSPAPHE
jgi:DNA repair exonuclease SbcCD ATPase subunit